MPEHLPTYSLLEQVHFLTIRFVGTFQHFVIHHSCTDVHLNNLPFSRAHIEPRVRLLTGSSQIVALPPKEGGSTGRNFLSVAPPAEHQSECHGDRKLSQQFPCALLNSAEFVSQQLDNRQANPSPSPPPTPEANVCTIQSPSAKSHPILTGS
ncbi:phosrestin-2-like [Tropilaelaps mercedesae]|uniref:Phosrestin-2-like n=1 Tax=Tropilaelaps mercedesae TaxID=418985 RepID=A0A1V9X9M6_9ACAR|nr:phosrestin-2-like [Tropilaelaps mercedesae]